MRKITLLLVSMLLLCTSAMAQFESNKCYTVVAEGHSKGGAPAWAVNDAGNAFVSTGNTTITNDNQKHFAFINFKNSTYIYSVSAKKFVKNNATLNPYGGDAVTIVELPDGKYLFKFDDQHFINIGGDKQMTIDGWGDGNNEVDGGNTMTVSPVGDVSSEDLSNAVANLLYPVTYTGQKSRTDRKLGSVTINGDQYDLTSDEQVQNFVNKTEKVFTVAPGSEVSITVTQSEGSWMNAFVYIDKDYDGFTAGIDSDGYTPTGDLVSYSFYNNGADIDTKGWNSAGTEITGGNRSTLTLPNFTAPSEPGIYRMRVKYDWCSIDPAGTTERYFDNTFTGHGGAIIDFTLVVDPKAEAKAALAEALDRANTFFSGITIGEELGQYSGGEFASNGLIQSFLGSSENFYNSINDETTLEQITEYTELVKATTDAYHLNMPVPGKFYRFKSNVTNEYVATPENKATGVRMSMTETSDTPNSIFYLTDDNCLINYVSGYYINGGNHAIYGYKSSFTFEESKTGVLGTYVIDSSTQNPWYADESNLNFYSEGTHANCNWIIEEVTSLPVSVSAVGYASFYAPVALTLQEGLEAYYVSSTEGDRAKFTQIHGTIPASTGVLLKNTGDYNLEIAETAAALESENLLHGTVPSEYITTVSYVLSKPADSEIGFYKAKMNKTVGEEPAFLNNGFKAYLPAPADAQGVNALRFFFGGEETGIETLVPTTDVNAAIYDLSGRRVKNAAKGGIYIQNGKKFIVK